MSNTEQHAKQAGNTWAAYASYRRQHNGRREPGQVSPEHWDWQVVL